uniref:UEV and lactate/malate dehyrogenase domains n=1 Tax=Propithecus coquereli TaxID=379532 RepID=A0A2K6F9E9_PROCO
MEFDCESLRRLLGKYKFRDLTVEELKNVNVFFPHFRYSMDTYGNTYNIPIRLWILDSHPFAPPICFLKPTANMGISVGKHVDAQGRIYLPYLQNWSHGIADRLVLLDLSEGNKGGTMDLDIFSLPNVEISKDLSASAHSKVVIFTVNSLGSSQSYLDVVQSNVDMFRALVPVLGHYSQHSVLLVASQPVEIMTYVTWKLSAFPVNQVIGIGCNLDSQRLQYIITNVLKAQTSGKEVWVIGEQGEDKVPAWGGQEVMSHNSQVQLFNRAMELLRVKGQRSWSVGLSVADLVDSIVNNKKKVHSVSILAKGYYDINNEVFLSLPCILGTNGVSEVIKTTVKEDTLTEKLQNSASSIHGLQQQLKL